MLIHIAFGFITGISISILIVTILTFFRHTIEQKVTLMQKSVENIGPHPKGFIVEPLNESEEFRDRVINRNKKIGKDTYIKDLL